MEIKKNKEKKAREEIPGLFIFGCFREE